MKIETVREINFFDIDSDQTLRVDAMARFFQEMAWWQKGLPSGYFLTFTGKKL